MGTLDILVRALGAEDAKDDLEGVQSGLKDTAKKAANDTKVMEKFATRFAGTMAIVTASMAAATAALLLKAPIISEIGFALGVLVEELAFVIDSVLAPVLEPLVEMIFDLAAKFDTLPGPVKTAITVIVLLTLAFSAILAIILGVAVALAAGSTAALVIVGAFALLASALTVIIVNLLFFAGLFAPLIAAWVLFKDTILSVVGVVRDKIDTFVSWFWATFGEEIMQTVDDVKATFDFWAAGVRAAFDNVKTAFMAIIGPLLWAWENDFLGIQTVTLGVLDAIGAAFSLVFDAIKTVVVGVVGDIIDAIQLVLALLRGDWSRAWEEARSIVGDKIDAINSLLSTVVSSFKGVAQSLVDTMNKVIDGMNALSITIPDWVPVYGGKTWSLSIPKIPALAVGGKVTSTGPATVHKGETVLTKQLTDMLEAFFASGGASGGDIIIYMDGSKIAHVVNKNNRIQASGYGWG